MTSISATPAPTTTPAAPKEPLVGGGVQGAVGDFLRGAGAGYAQATHLEGVQADKASIVPFETVITATSLLKDKTANIKGVNKATSILNTVAGFGMLILAANTAGTLRAPGDTAKDLVDHVADAIDGKKTAQGWNIGWGVVAGESGANAVQAAPSAAGTALSNLGMH